MLAHSVCYDDSAVGQNLESIEPPELVMRIPLDGPNPEQFRDSPASLIRPEWGTEVLYVGDPFSVGDGPVPLSSGYRLADAASGADDEQQARIGQQEPSDEMPSQSEDYDC